MEQLVLLLTTFFSLAAAAKPDELVAKINTFTEQLKAAGVVAKEGTAITAQSAMEWLNAQLKELKTFKANYGTVAKALGAAENDPVEKLTALIATAKDRTGLVSKADFDALQNKFNEREVDELIAAAMAKGKISPATRDSYRALALKDRQTFVDLMAKTADYSVVPLQKIETSTAVATHTEDGQPSVEAIQAYAAKEKISFKEAAIAMTARKN